MKNDIEKWADQLTDLTKSQRKVLNYLVVRCGGGDVCFTSDIACAHLKMNKTFFASTLMYLRQKGCITNLNGIKSATK